MPFLRFAPVALIQRKSDILGPGGRQAETEGFPVGAVALGGRRKHIKRNRIARLVLRVRWRGVRALGRGISRQRIDEGVRPPVVENRRGRDDDNQRNGRPERKNVVPVEVSCSCCVGQRIEPHPDFQSAPGEYLG